MKKNKLNKALPAAQPEVAERIRDTIKTTTDKQLVIDFMWRSLIRTGVYIKLLEAEVESFADLQVHPLKQLVSDQLVNLKRYRLRMASMFATDDKEVVEILHDDMDHDSVYDIGDVIDLMKKFDNTELFLKVVKHVVKLTNIPEDNKSVYAAIEEELNMLR